MPAVSSSPIAALSRHLAPLGEVGPQERGGLLEVLESVPDPRKKRGVRHRFSAILFVSVCAVVSGARSFAAIAEWAGDAVGDTLRGLGIGAPNASTIRRALSAFTGDGFDTAIGGFLAGRLAASRAKAGARVRRHAIAVDGKALRGSRVRDVNGDGRPRMLMACLDHAAAVTLGQVEISEKTNEVRREVPCRISHSARRNSEESSWIRRLTRIPKGEGDQSMPVQTWWSCPRVGAVRQGDPCDTANAGLHEAQSPVMQVFIHRKPTCETGAALCVGLFRWPVQPPQRWAMPCEGIEGDEWDA